jgi:hypothetical protein
LTLTSTASYLTKINIKETANPIIENKAEPSLNVKSDKKLRSDSEITLQADRIYLNIPACAFIPNNENADYFISTQYITTTDLGGYFFTPVYLPKGATISELAAWWKDSIVGNGALTLYRYHPVTQEIESMATVESIGDQNNYHWSNTQTINNPEVDDSHSYLLSLYLKDGIKCFGARIAYTPATVKIIENNMVKD